MEISVLFSVLGKRKGQSEIVFISADWCYSCILNSINKRNPTAFAISAEVNESELEDDNLGLEKFLDSEVDIVDGEHEANAAIRSRRQRGARKRNFGDMVYY